jgi:hypothetical protein
MEKSVFQHNLNDWWTLRTFFAVAVFQHNLNDWLNLRTFVAVALKENTTMNTTMTRQVNILDVLVNVASNIAEYLDGVEDLLAFGKVWPEIRNIVCRKEVLHSMILRNVEQYIVSSNFVNSFDELGFIMEEFNLAISGSVVLLGILGDNWHMKEPEITRLNPVACNDVDLFYKGNSDERPLPITIIMLCKCMRAFGYRCTNGADIAERSNNMYVYTEDNGLSLHPDPTLNAVFNITIDDRSDLYLGVVNFDKHISANGEDVVRKIQVIYSSSHSKN